MKEPISNPIAKQDGASRADIASELALGGQALIEGVLMRSPHKVAMAVRKPEGELVVYSYSYVPLARRFKFFSLPIIRGAVGLFESLAIGFRALSWSAEQASSPKASNERAGAAKMRERLGMALSFLLATALALGIFMYFPLWVGKLLSGSGGQNLTARQVTVNVAAGVVRVLVLLAYLSVISIFRDIRRVFQYHGSEHKTIFAFESGGDLTTERIMEHPRFHPRCGTSFLLIVVLAAIVFFVVVDAFVVALFGDYPGVWARFLVHLPLLPLVAGISYEILKLSARHINRPLVKAFIQPGLWLQRITTREPEPAMCDVAAQALRTALAETEPNRF